MSEQLEIFPWNENFATGIEEIDVQHMRLVSLLNVLVSHLAFNADVPAINKIFDELKQYTVEHFTTEERIWHVYFKNDPWEAWHKDSHSDFIAEVLRIKEKENVLSMDEVVAEIVTFLTHWLALHIIESDKRMAKVVLALPSGISLERAKEQADQEMLGATRVLIATVMGMYDKLANRTIEMTREIGRRMKAEAELRAAHEEMQRLRDAAIEASTAKSHFLATMSHEIRTPLNGILGMAQLLLTENELVEEERKDYARTIHNSGQTLLMLLNDILDLSKLEASKMQLSSMVFEPRRMIEEIALLFSQSAQAKGLSLEAEWIGAADRHYLGDAFRLRQMLSNLLNNAIKFTHRGSIRIEAREVECANGQATLEVSVSDSGIGISQDKQAQLFQPFSQADHTIPSEYGGTGLGLSIIRNLAQLMHGTVGVDSTEGQGSRFWFRVRVGLPGANAGTPERTRGAAPEAPGDALSGTVLIVEDNAINRKVAVSLLRKLGLASFCAENGQEALDHLRQGQNPDLVLMDIQMPVMNGIEATGHIRAWEKESGRLPLPIVALTANAYEEDRQRCQAAGMDDFLAKPINLEELRQILLTWLGKIEDTVN